MDCEISWSTCKYKISGPRIDYEKLQGLWKIVGIDKLWKSFNYYVFVQIDQYYLYIYIELDI